MITPLDFYHVMTAMVPLYVAMILAYGSVRWWKIFTPDQCSGINRFVALFAVPLLSFHFIAGNNPYTMNLRFIAADTLQKLIVLALLFAASALTRYGSLEWTITVFALSTLPNTLVMGIPLLQGMYGGDSGSLMVQVVVLQCIIWYTLMLFMFEYRAARILISDQFPNNAGSIASIAVDSDVVSLDGREPVETEAHVQEDGRLKVIVRRSNASRSDVFSRRSGGFSGATPRPSNLTNAEIYSLQSSRNPTPRGSSFNHTDFFSMVAATGGRPSNFDGFNTSRGPTPRPSNFEEESVGKPRYHFPAAGAGAGAGAGQYPLPNPGMFSPTNAPKPTSGANKLNEQTPAPVKDLHMFVWSSSNSPVSEVFGNNPEYTAAGDHKEVRVTVPPSKGMMEGSNKEGNRREYVERDNEFSFGNRTFEEEVAGEGGAGKGGAGKKGTATPPTSVMTRLILIMVWRKLIRNPNTYSSLIGLTWALVSFKWNIMMPAIIAKSISILSDAGLGMAMFSLGLFMALQPRIIACGNRKATFAMAVRFVAGPIVMTASSFAIGLRGRLLHIAIVQAALPQGIVPFVFAKEYNLHPTILSTAVIFGMLIALPITLIYYILLGL